MRNNIYKKKLKTFLKKENSKYGLFKTPFMFFSSFLGAFYYYYSSTPTVEMRGIRLSKGIGVLLLVYGDIEIFGNFIL
jgi:hypothetical protein